MASTANMQVYVKEFIAGFDKTQSLLRDTVTTKTMGEGISATFVTNNTSGIDAVTRGSNGLIPSQQLDLTQNTATLVPWHTKLTSNDFNAFTNQADVVQMMMAGAQAAINKKIDSDIHTVLAEATNDTGSATAGTFDLIVKAITIAQNNQVPNDGNLTLLATPALIGKLMSTPQFTSADYIDTRTVAGNTVAWGDKRGFYKWMGLKIIVDSGLPNLGTNSEKCFLYHKSAVGQAIRMGEKEVAMGYDEQDAYSYVRVSTFTGAKLLQNSGVVVINHDGSSYAAS